MSKWTAAKQRPPTPHRAMAGAAFLLIVAAYAAMALAYPLGYIVATYEDFVGEWAQVWFYAVTAGLALRLAIVPSHFRVFFCVLALACLYVFLEEISWGQRLFNVATPEFFQRHNLQQETNLHNLLTGPYSTALKQGMEIGLALTLFGFGLLYPLWLLHGSRLAEGLERAGLPAPPLHLWPFFTTAAVLELEPFGFNEAELAEILVSSALALYTWHYWSARHLPPARQWQSCSIPALSRRSALGMAGMIPGIFLLASASTYAAYATPHLRAGMEARIDQGIEKFARRYRGYGLRGQAIDLYRLLDARHPDDPDVLQGLARAYQEAGDQDNFKRHAHRALALDLAAVDTNPENVAARLSLSRSYKLLRAYEKSLEHLQTALSLARAQHQSQPANAGSAYQLGQVHEQMAEYAAALEQYRLAMELAPEKQYIAAYRRLALPRSADAAE